MNKTLKISFSLKNTYRVNGILFSLKQIPLLKRLLPATLYQVKGLKIFANILSVLWEIVSTFIGKFLYFITMVCGIGILYKGLPENEVFLHILLILTVIGSFVNTHLFNPTNGTYEVMQKTPKGTDYEIIIDGVTGYATVSPTEYYDETEIPTLPINIDGYSLYFIPKE